ncbi:very long-chain acyl-CoA synthetase-like [Alosa sapidissima]|uniref:very long-chain acyl-CoA synthetase-like n=1 Tax=Alosa sapidissima TaxID=34773 RepID=UPI001C092F95|nr:very long-chain acyl-CoA synthetase-like [Alosa sapidissima]
MYAIFTFLVGLAFLPFFIYARFPYFLDDVRYIFNGISIGNRVKRYASKKPCYTLLDCFLDKVKAHPLKSFLIFENETYSYQDADRRSNKVARALSQHSKLQEEDAVALFLGNEPTYVWLWLGLTKLGCVPALINYNIRTKSLLHCFSCCGAKVLIAAAELKDAVVEVLPALQEQNVSVFILSKECDTEGIETLSDKIDAVSDEPVPLALNSNLTIKSPALYIYTSGTTGLPKAAVINHERVWLASSMQTVAGVRGDDIIYVYLPLYHSAGFLMGLTGAIDQGITVVLKRKFSASQFWNDCRKHNVTVIQYIGEIMRYLCNAPKKDNDQNHMVRVALGNGIRADTWAEFLQRFGDIRIVECYGATEGNTGFVNYVGKVGATGRVLTIQKKAQPFALIKYDTERGEPVRDSRGFCVEVATGEAGLLVAKITKRAPFTGYANNTQQTEKKRLRDVFEKGDLYFDSGDLLKMDEEGFIYFQDRIGDTFRWKGENVATTEVTDVLVTLDFIEEANVYGVKVPGNEGRIGMASLKITEGMEFNSTATYDHVKAYLPSYARPRFIRIQNSLELTGTYKQMKVKLAEEGFDPSAIDEAMYFLEESQGYIPMTKDIYSAINDGSMRL